MSTLNENILKVKETFDNIAIAIEEQGVDVGECDSPTTYADKIRSIVGTGGGLDPEKLYTEAFETEDNVSVTPSLTEDGGVMLTFGLKRGPAGPAGQDGRDGVDGQDGQDGAQGPVGPAGPAGPKGDNGATPIFKIEDGYWYVSYDNTTWTLMGKATGEDGKDGEDGEDGTGSDVNEFRIEFIYKRVADKNVEVLKPENSQEDRYQPEGWTLAPQGVTSEFQVEYVSQREKDNDEWQDWSEPAVWAIYGSEGRDGNGIEYIFKLTESESAIPEIPIAPAEGEEQYPADWSDEPLSVTEETPCCWVSTRHQYYNAEGIQMWSEYSIPSLWAKYGKDGEIGPQGPAGEKGDKGDPGTLSDEDKQAIVTEAVENLNKSFYTIAEIDALKKNLQEAIESGDAKATADAASALNAANSFNAELASLKSKFNTNEDGTLGTLNSSALNESDIYDLSVAALGNDIEDSEGELHEDALFAKQIVGVISTFGSVKADNIVGDTITGKTIQSADTDADGNIIEGSKGNAWKLESTGAGRLANGSITWEADGTVTLGPNVKFTWTDENKPTVDTDVDETLIYCDSCDFWAKYSGKTVDFSSPYLWINVNGDLEYAYATDSLEPEIGDGVLVLYKLSGDSLNNIEWDTDEGNTITDVKTINASTGLTEAEVINIIKNTEISASKIIAPEIGANGIDAEYITAGKLSAERLNINEIAAEVAKVDDLSVKKLDTIPSGNYSSGKITIQDNDFYAYKKDGGEPVINISSDSNSNAFIEHNHIPKSINFSVNQVDVTVPHIALNISDESEELYANGYTTVKLTSFQTSFLYKNRWSYQYEPESYPTGTADFTATLEGTEDNTDIKPDYLDVCCYYVFAKQGASIPFDTFKPVANNEYAKVGEDDTATCITEINTCGLYFYDGHFKNVGFGELPLQDSTSYDVYLFVSVDIRATNNTGEGTWSDWNFDLTFKRYLNSETPYYFIKGKIEPKTESFVGITPKGFQHLVSYDQHITSSGSRILMRSGKWMFGIDAEGPFISDGTTTYNFDLSKMTARSSSSYYRYEY